MLYAIYYDLYNFKNVKTPMEECLLKVTLLHGCFHVFKIVQMAQNRAKHHKFTKMLHKRY